MAPLRNFDSRRFFWAACFWLEKSISRRSDEQEKTFQVQCHKAQHFHRNLVERGCVPREPPRTTRFNLGRTGINSTTNCPRKRASWEAGSFTLQIDSSV